MRASVPAIGVRFVPGYRWAWGYSTEVDDGLSLRIILVLGGYNPIVICSAGYISDIRIQVPTLPIYAKPSIVDLAS